MGFSFSEDSALRRTEIQRRIPFPDPEGVTEQSPGSRGSASATWEGEWRESMNANGVTDDGTPPWVTPLGFRTMGAHRVSQGAHKACAPGLCWVTPMGFNSRRTLLEFVFKSREKCKAIAVVIRVEL
jgi:hypothetical protein